jgi:hypothetical protein
VDPAPLLAERERIGAELDEIVYAPRTSDLTDAEFARCGELLDALVDVDTALIAAGYPVNTTLALALLED